MKLSGTDSIYLTLGLLLTIATTGAFYSSFWRGWLNWKSFENSSAIFNLRYYEYCLQITSSQLY